MVPQPAAWPVADERLRVRPAGRHPHRDRHRPAVLRRLQPAVRRLEPADARRRSARLLPVRLADQPDLALPRHPGPARRARAGAGTDRAGQALVGDAEAGGAAALPYAGPTARAAQPGAARRRHRLRDGHRRPQRPELVRLRLQLLHGPPLRSLGLPRRLRRPRRDQAPGDAALAAQPGPPAPNYGPRWPRPVRSPRTRTGWSPRIPPRRRSAGAGCWPSSAAAASSSRR